MRSVCGARFWVQKLEASGHHNDKRVDRNSLGVNMFLAHLHIMISRASTANRFDLAIDSARLISIFEGTRYLGNNRFGQTEC